jgi:hypothetical protein
MRRALIVGIDNYSFGPLHGCVTDARKMKEVLSHNENGDFPSQNFECQVLTSDKIKVTKKELSKAIKRLFHDPAGIISTSVFYFAGHGFENDLGGYLVTEDAQQYSEGIAMRDIIQWCATSPIKEIILILDCCHAGHLGNTEPDSPQRAFLPKGVSIITSSEAGQSSEERNGEGLFTSIIHEALLGAAADIRGVITVASVYHYADRMLGAFDQRPIFKTYVPKMTQLRQVTPRVSQKQLIDLTKLFKTADSHFPLDKSYEPTENPKHDEHEKLFALLQKLTSADLVYPVDEDHMYYAAINGKACALTPQGKLYWTLTQKGRFYRA